MANFKKFYYVLSTSYRWGRGTNLAKILKDMHITKASKYVIYIGVVKYEATDEQVINLCNCFYVNDMGGICTCNDLKEEDQAEIEKLFMGWISEESFLPPFKS